MKIRGKKMLGGLLILSLILSGSKTAPREFAGKVKKPLVIGAAIASEDSSYLQEVSRYMVAEARRQGVVLLLAYAGWDAQIQAQQLAEFCRQKVDAIIFCPVNAKALLMPLKKIKSAKIPVINLNMRVDAVSSVYTDAYVGASNAEEASLAAVMVTKLLGEQGGQIGIIEGAPGSDAQIYRTQTFVEQLIPFPKIKVVGLGEGSWNRNTARLAAWDMLKKYKDLQVIYCHDSNMAMGAIAAIEELGLKGRVKVIGISESFEYLRAVQDGRLYGLITQPPEYEGITGVQTAVDAAKGKILHAWYKNPIEMVTGENVNRFLLKN